MLTRFCFLKIPIASIVTTQRCRVALESSVFLELLPIEETKALLASNSESGLNRIAPPPSQITEQRSLASSHNCAGVIHAAIIVVPGRLFAVVQLSYAYIITPHPLPSSLYTQPTCAFAFTSRSRGYRCKYKNTGVRNDRSHFVQFWGSEYLRNCYGNDLNFLYCSVLWDFSIVFSFLVRHLPWNHWNSKWYFLLSKRSTQAGPFSLRRTDNLKQELVNSPSRAADLVLAISLTGKGAVEFPSAKLLGWCSSSSDNEWVK